MRSASKGMNFTGVDLKIQFVGADLKSHFSLFQVHKFSPKAMKFQTLCRPIRLSHRPVP